MELGYRTGVQYRSHGEETYTIIPGSDDISHVERRGVLTGYLENPGAPGERRRPRAEIIYSILGVIEEQGVARKNRIMQLANLNSRAFHTHVEELLVARGFVAKRRIGRSMFYAVTPLGRRLRTALGVLKSLGLFEQPRRSSGLARLLHEAGLKPLYLDEATGYALLEQPCSEGSAPVHVLYDPAVARLDLGSLVYEASVHTAGPAVAVLIDQSDRGIVARVGGEEPLVVTVASAFSLRKRVEEAVSLLSCRSGPERRVSL